MFIATNLTDLHREPSFLSEMLTQMFYGMTCEVLEEKEKWCRVRLSDGYEGWAHRPYLAEGSPPAATHVVFEPFVGIQSEPMTGKPPRGRLFAGTQVQVIEQRDSFSLVRPVGGMLSEGWVMSLFLRPLDHLPLSAHQARTHIVHFARALTGVYYLWGGNTGFGTDCSGLAWQAHRICGYQIPRDAHPQFQAAAIVEPPYQPGDLFFFHKDADPNRIGHVGISVGGWRMIHSSRARNGVYEEDMQANDDLRRNFAGARTFVPR